jgi:hypothetical protein
MREASRVVAIAAAVGMTAMMRAPQAQKAAMPLYSEGDDSLEVDTVRVQRRGPDGVWRIGFVDPAIVATVGVDAKSRAQTAYSHTFRKDQPSLKAGTVWRQEYAPCKPGA